jgi:hypothetical protein
MQSQQHLISSIFSRQSAAISVWNVLKSKGIAESKMRIDYASFALLLRTKTSGSDPLYRNKLPLAGMGYTRGLLLRRLEAFYQWLYAWIGKTPTKLSVMTFSAEETSIVSEVMQSSVNLYCDQLIVTA